MAIRKTIKLLIVISIAYLVKADDTQPDVQLIYYSQQWPQGVNVTENTTDALHGTDFEGFYRYTYYIIYGFEDPSGEDKYKIKDTILNQCGKDECNVFIVDWSGLAKKNLSARATVVYLSDVIWHITDDLVILPVNIQIIASSLGAQAAGRAAFLMHRLPYKIQALDPVIIDPDNPTEFLNSSSCYLVEVIHTNGGQIGVSEAIGHIDFFPNGGKKQPGCVNDDDGSCSHERAILYYTESLADGLEFISKICGSYEDYLNGLCDHNRIIRMGTLTDYPKINGTFYLTTNSEPPFAKG